MNIEHYLSISKCIKDGKIGTPKVIRVSKNIGYMTKQVSKITKEIIYNLLYEGISFIFTNLGEVIKLYSKSIDLENTIIIMKHKNNTLSHISINFFDYPVFESFRIEVAGDGGLVEYDSESKIGVFSNTKMNLTQRNLNDLNAEIDYMNKNMNKNITEILDKIFSSLDVLKEAK